MYCPGLPLFAQGALARLIPWIMGLAILLVFIQPPLTAQDGPYTDAFLDGPHQAHDLFSLDDGTGRAGSGTRSFDGAGRVFSLVSVASRTPLGYEMDDQGRFRLSAAGFNPGRVGALWYVGGLAVYAPQLAPAADEQLPEGYGALGLSAALGSGYRDSDFSGNYSYHALLFSEAGWWNVFGAGEANGNGSLLQFQSDAAPWALTYGVESNGAVAVGNDGAGLATLLDDGSALVQTIQARANENPFYPQSHAGLGFYIRRGSGPSSLTSSQFSGVYEVLSLTVNANGAGMAGVGRITAGGPGVFEGERRGQAYAGRIELFDTGVFRIEGDGDRVGTLGAGGDFAVITRENAQPGQAASLEIWLRTAGGRPLPGDADGDGLRDAVELARGLNPSNRDMDNDGWIDGADPRPSTPDNVFTAGIEAPEIEVVEGSTSIIEAVLTLDSDNFPYFDWELESNATWLTPVITEGQGDGTVTLRIDPRSLTAEDSPHTAQITVDAPFMRSIDGPSIAVNVISDSIQIEATPSTVEVTAVEGATRPLTTSLAIASPDVPNFSWRIEALPSWLAVSPDAGNGAATVIVTIDPQQLSVAQSPIEASLRIASLGAGATNLDVAVTVTVLPPRSLGETFLPAPGDTSQSSPALAFDPVQERNLLAWQEGAQVYATIFDWEGTPILDRQRMSQPAEGEAFRPTVAIDPVSRLGYVIWEQVFQVGEDLRSQIQYRTVHMDTRALRPFPTGLPTSGGFLTRPKGVFHAGRAEIGILYLQADGDRTRLRLLQMNPTDASRISDVALLDEEALPLAIEGLSIAPERGGNGYGLSWLEGRVGFAAERARFMAWDSASGEAGREEDFGAATGTATGAVAGSMAGEWGIAFEGPERRLQAILLRPDGTTEQIDAFTTRGAGLGVSVAYAPQAEQFLVHWSANPASVERRSTWQYLTLGAHPIKPETSADRFTAASAGVANVYNPSRNEFVLSWAGSSGIAAVRLDGGSTDEDNDGLPNDWEFSFGLDPLSDAGDDGAEGDPDKDSLSNFEEWGMGTSPILADTDGDGLLDRQEDRNRDGRLDRDETSPRLVDTDGDGAEDYAEWFQGTNGNDPTDMPGSGILRAIYEAPLPGEVMELSLDVYVAGEAEYQLHLNSPDIPGWNPPPGWESNAPVMHDGQLLVQGVHRLSLTFTAPDFADPAVLTGDFAFRLEGLGVSDVLNISLVVAPLKTAQFDGTNADELAERFAPVIRSHRDAFLPLVAVEQVWEEAQLYTSPQRPIPPAPDALDMYQSPQREAYLDLPGEDLDALIAAFSEALAPAVYYTVARLEGPSQAAAVPVGHTVLQYYCYFPASGWGRERLSGHRHEGHWQVAQVLLDETLQAYRLILSQQWRAAGFRDMAPAVSIPWERIQKTGDTHPVIYRARGSHSLHALPGSTRQDVALEEHDGLGGWQFPDNQTELTADYSKTETYRLVALGRLGETNAQSWLRFAGRWGQLGYPAGPQDLSSAALRDGPRGPVFMAAPLGDESRMVRPWLDPWAWAAWAEVLPEPGIVAVEATLPEDLRGRTAVLLDARGQIFRTPVDPETGALRFEVPPQHYTLQVVETNALGQESWRASALFDTGFGTSMLFPTLPQGEMTDLGPLRLENDRLVGSAIYEISDADGDGLSDFQDLDADSDGQENADDNDMLGDGFADALQIQESDETGIPRYYGLLAEEEDDSPADFDNDGFIDAIDLDWDNDGFANEEELSASTNPRNFFDSPAWRAGDLDRDGTRHIAEAQRMVNMALRREAYNPRADFDANGQIDAVDIHAMLRAMLAEAQ